MDVKDLIDNPDLTADDIVGVKIGMMSPDRVVRISPQHNKIKHKVSAA